MEGPLINSAHVRGNILGDDPELGISQREHRPERQPVRAGIDPRDLLSDWEIDDNVAAVKIQKRELSLVRTMRNRGCGLVMGIAVPLRRSR